MIFKWRKSIISLMWRIDDSCQLAYLCNSQFWFVSHLYSAILYIYVQVYVYTYNRSYLGIFFGKWKVILIHFRRPGFLYVYSLLFIELRMNFVLAPLCTVQNWGGNSNLPKGSPFRFVLLVLCRRLGARKLAAKLRADPLEEKGPT